MKKRNEKNRKTNDSTNDVITIIFIIVISICIGIGAFFYFYEFEDDSNIKKYFAIESTHE